MEFKFEKSPSLERDLMIAKLQLMKCSNATGDCIFDHLSEIIAKVLDEKPEDAVDCFEQISRKVKEERFRIKDNILENTFVEPDKLDIAKKRLKLLTVSRPVLSELIYKDVNEENNELEPPVKDIMQLQFYWNLLGIGFPPEEIFVLSVALRRLKKNSHIHSCRFWGKLFCLKGNYFVAECKLTEVELEKRKMQIQNESDSEILNFNSNSPQIETVGKGLNRFIYYVCDKPGNDWVELPSVTFEELYVSREIRKYLTGDLRHEINSYPEFPGNEMNYLRCLIAKISSSTQISPAGYYKFGGSDNEDTDSKSDLQSNDPSIIRNLSYEPVNVKKLLDTKNWVHHQPNILENGKPKWIHSKSLEKKYEQATDDENDEFEKSTPENSFKLLSFCCEDTTSENIQPWTSKLTCVNDSRNYLVHMRSNLWPGAFAFAYERTVDNIYMGFGHKYVSRNVTPALLPPIQAQFIMSAEIMEMNDPRTQEENLLN